MGFNFSSSRLNSLLDCCTWTCAIAWGVCLAAKKNNENNPIFTFGIFSLWKCFSTLIPLHFFFYLEICKNPRVTKKRSEQVLDKHQAAGSHVVEPVVNNSPHHLCMYFQSGWQGFQTFLCHPFCGILHGHLCSSASIPLSTTCWTKWQHECLWSARSWTVTQHYRPNLYQSVAALSPLLFGMLRGTKCWGQRVSPSWHRPELVQGYSLI